MQLIWCLLSNFYLNMFRASLCPSSGEQECALPHMVFTSYGFVPLLLQCRTPYAAVHTLVLLMKGIMMPETCWDKSLKINIRLVASCWFLSLHPNLLYIGQTLSHLVYSYQSLRHRMENFKTKWTPSYVRLIKLKPSFVRVSDFKSFSVNLTMLMPY